MANAKEDPALSVAKAIAGRWNWLARLMVGENKLTDVRIEGVSIRCDSGAVLVVVRGLRYSDATFVVAFGSGERLYEALRNVTTTITQGGWKADKYRKLGQ